MPECVLSAYLEQLPRLKAERLLDGAQIASVPYMTPSGAKRWYEGALARLEPVAVAVPKARPALSFNGIPMSTPAIRQRLGQVLGGGLSA